MSLSQALAAAVSGLRANQAGLSIVAGNVANAGTPGYIRKTITPVTISGGDTAIGVRAGDVSRALDEFVQKQLRSESSGGAFADMRARLYDQLQALYGRPGSDSSLDATFNKFTAALQALSASPNDSSVRNSVVGAAQLFAQQLNSMSAGVQLLRQDAETSIGNAVSQANLAMQKIADINQQVATSTINDGAMATLLDRRDAMIDELSQLMDITVLKGDNHQVSIYTASGMPLVGLKASVLAFDGGGTVTPSTEWTRDPDTRGLGTITLTSPNGGVVDLIETKAIRSGQIAALLQMRDQDLVAAQNQLDAIAGALASALSDRGITGTPVTSGAQAGFNIDIAGLKAGNTVTVQYLDKLTNTQRSATFVRVDDPSILPLSAAPGNLPGKVYGIDFSGGMAAAISQINAALATTGMTASNPSGSLLRLLDDGTGGRVAINSVSATATTTTFGSGNAELPFFMDGAASYTGALTAAGAQARGFAGRIRVNSALAGDPLLLVAYTGGVASGDPTRPNFILDRLANAQLTFDPNSGIGTSASPFAGTLGGFLRQVISQQGEAAASAQGLKQGQDVVVAALQQRFAEGASVNIDQEMTNLLNLQNSYAANARVMSAVKEMLDALMRM
ncbi:MAG: flagellar hook-associated protein FlgK [Pseudolabrys sp.]|nr:flagellar hook-associated protein FlgK [Pseudolabrys sp.]